jgi:hypothetical protein
MNSLPHELHCAIASHLIDRTDLATYRLTNKRTAIAGAEFLFAIFPAFPTHSTITRMKKLLASPHARHVHTITYSGHVHTITYSGHVPNIPPSQQITNLQPRIVCSVVRGFGVQMKHLYATNLSLLSLSPLDGAADDKFLLACANLTTLNLSFDGCTHDPESSLMRMRELLGGLEELTDLSVRFSDQIALRDCVQVGRTWAGLRRFEVENVEVNEEDVVGFLANHKDTLEGVRLENVMLDVHWEAERAKEWRRIFDALGECTKLEEGYVREEVRSERVHDERGNFIREEDKNVKEIREWRFGEREVVVRTNVTRWLVGGEYDEFYRMNGRT